MKDDHFSFVDWDCLFPDGETRSRGVREIIVPFPQEFGSSKHIFVKRNDDLFDESISDKTLRLVWDIMWCHPQHTFLILTKNPERMRRFICQWADSRHHGWSEDERHPICHGDIVHINDFWERGVCGWRVSKTDVNCGCACGHPEHEEHDGKSPGSCDARCCPVADQLDKNDEECKLDPDDPNYYEPDEGYMKIHSRPRFAFAKNIWLGVTVDSQVTVNRRVGTLLCTPAAKRFVSVEAMLSPVNLEKVFLYGLGFDAYWGDQVNAFTGEPFGPPRSQYNCDGCLASKLDWVICGEEKEPEISLRKRDWIKNLRDQCVRNKTPFHFKWKNNQQHKIESDRDDLIDGAEWKQYPEEKNETY